MPDREPIHEIRFTVTGDDSFPWSYPIAMLPLVVEKHYPYLEKIHITLLVYQYDSKEKDRWKDRGTSVEFPLTQIMLDNYAMLTVYKQLKHEFFAETKTLRRLRLDLLTLQILRTGKQFFKEQGVTE